MKTKSNKLYSGGRKVVEGKRQAEAHRGRTENQDHKSRFSAGPHAKNDPEAGRPNGPLLPLHQVEVKPRRKK
jgi:hypothetical protein